MVDILSIGERVAKLSLGVAKLVIGGERIDTAADILKLATDGRSIYDDLRGDAETALATRLMRAVDAEIAALAKTNEWSESARLDAEAHLRQAIDHCRPTAQDIAAANADPALLVERLRLVIVAKGGELGRIMAETTPGRRLFAKVFTRTLSDLLDDTEFRAKVEPALWREALGGLDEIKEDTGAIRDDLNDMKAMLAEALADKSTDAARAGVERAALDEISKAVLAHAEGRAMEPAEIADAVRRRVDNLIETVERLERKGNVPDPMEAERKRIADLFRAGRFRDAEDAQEALTERELEEIDARRQRIAEDTARAAQSAEDRFDYLRAAALWEKAARAHDGDPLERCGLISRRANSFYLQGLEQGDNESLETAAKIYREEVLPVMPPEVHASHWREAINSCGNVLMTLGQRLRKNTKLEEAVACFEEGLAHTKRNDAPAQWATFQSNLGAALVSLGEREVGLDKHERAVEAFIGALEELPRETYSQSWAATQNALATALHRIGVTTPGSAILERSIAAYRLALEELPRERMPIIWASTQNNLGKALQDLGEREEGSARLEEAIGSYELALEESRRERVPLEWAMAQNNLGTALQIIGNREANAERVWEAVDAYEKALQERRRDRVPLYWASTKNNLGNAYQLLANLHEDEALLEKAIASYREALLESRRHLVPLEWAGVQNNLGGALSKLGEVTADKGLLEDAIAAYQEALKEQTRDKAPLAWAMASGNEGATMLALAEFTGDLEQAREGKKRLETAISEARAGGNLPLAAIFEGHLPRATDLVAALS